MTASDLAETQARIAIGTMPGLRHAELANLAAVLEIAYVQGYADGWDARHGAPTSAAEPGRRA